MASLIPSLQKLSLKESTFTFLSSKFKRPLPEQIPLTTFTTSVEAMSQHMLVLNPVSNAECTHPYVESWDVQKCDKCAKDLGQLRQTTEENHAAKAKEEDKASAISFGGAINVVLVANRLLNKTKETKEATEIEQLAHNHGAYLHTFAISVFALLAFTFDHDCWEWPTWKVVREIIKPATGKTRCRYAQLPGLEKYFGPARVFISHCWSAKFVS